MTALSFGKNSTDLVRKYLEISPKKFRKFGEILSDSSQINFLFSEKFVEIYFPKLLEIRHRDAISARIRLEISPKKSRIREEKNRREEEEEEEEASSRGLTEVKKQEIRFRFAKEISEIEKLLATLFDGWVPKNITTRVPEMIYRCGGDPAMVCEVLNDLYQSPKIRGEGLQGSKRSYVAKVLSNHFFEGAG